MDLNKFGKRKLIFRLSSLGDVILASSILKTLDPGQVIDWVISSEFAELLEGHPRIGKLWRFDRREGLRSWLRLCREIWAEDYDEVFDLHKTLRTRIARVFLSFKFLSSSTRVPLPRWRSISKQRFRLLGFFTFKSIWPTSCRPDPWFKRFSECFGAGKASSPDLSHLLGESPLREVSDYYCVMPSSKWKSKEWSPEKYVDLIRRLKGMPVILGSAQDQASKLLVSLLQANNIDCISGVGKWSLKEVGTVLAGSRALIGGDTGLAHLAEAVGTSVITLFGPTVPTMGWGPLRADSLSVGLPLWCRPCGKDGRNCFRPIQRYKCLSHLEVDSVVNVILSSNLASKISPGRKRVSPPVGS